VLRIGLTGGIGAGKSTAAEELAAHGAVIIDADLLAREVVAPGTPGLAAIEARFGSELVPGGELDRSALGKLVFADPAARRDLEAIIHPAVRARAAELERAAGPDAVVVQVIPLLVETGQQHAFDAVIVIDVDQETQVARLQARNGLSRAEAEERIAAQATREQRIAAADIVVRNDGSVTQLRTRIADAWTELMSSGTRK
jgi:dephospho-CoA kinase